MAAPTVGFLLAIFIGECLFKSAARRDARAPTSAAVKAPCGRVVKKSSETTPSRSTPTRDFARSCGMRRHHDATALLAWTHRSLRGVIQATRRVHFPDG